MNEGCEVHFCPIYCRIPQLNSINLAVWSDVNQTQAAGPAAILFSKTRPDVQEPNHVPLYCWFTLISTIYPCSSVAVKYCTLREKGNLSIYFFFRFFRICSSTVRIQWCNLLQFTQFGADKTLLESINGSPDTRISSFSPLGNCIHFCSSYCLLPKSTKNLKAF